LTQKFNSVVFVLDLPVRKRSGVLVGPHFLANQ